MADFDNEAALRHRHRNVNNDTRVVNLEELNSDDAELAAKFGYKPVMKREFGYLATFSFAVSISGLFSTIATTFSYPLSAGGSASAVWCWLISGAGCMCLAVCILPFRINATRDEYLCSDCADSSCVQCSVAELVSAYPTSGGLYFTVSRLTPRSWVPSISW